MKRFFLFLVSALLTAVLAAGIAEEARPGEEVTVVLRLENTNAAYVRVVAEYDGDIFELVGYTAADGVAGSKGIVILASQDLILKGKPLPSGAVGTVTLRVREDAAPGEYAVSGMLAECYDLAENDGTAAATGGTVTVLPACEHKDTAWEETKAPTCAEEGERKLICADCGMTLETETIAKIDHTPGPCA